MRILNLLIISAFISLLMISCVKYKPKPLVPENIIKEIDALRDVDFVSAKGELPFMKAATLMSEKGPLLLAIKAKYETVQSVANIKTPWFNPSLEFGPEAGFDLDPSATNKIVPFISLGFTIPFGGKLKKNDDLNKAKALRAFIEVQVQHREMYLDLREKYTQLYLSFQKLKVQQDLVKSSKLMLKLSKTMMKVGATTALDVGMIELESNKEELELLEIQNELGEFRARLSVLLGVDATKIKHISKSSLQQLDDEIPAYKKLKSILVKNHLELARFRFDYEVAEKSLRVEISKQYPDFNFGVSHAGEAGDKSYTLGLSIGIDIPIFDKNQQGIAQATKEREEIRKDYIATVHKALSELKRSFESIKNNIKKQKLLEEVIKPRAEGNLKMARQALETGGIDALKYLDVLRTYQETMKDVALIESDIRLAWIDLEKVLGVPLTPYPGENKFDISIDPIKASKTKETKNAK